MPIDLQQLLPTFIEESLENVEEMEECLLAIDLQAVDLERVNKIFRAVHTLKGNSKIFNFPIIGDFAHVVESFLDQVRQGSEALKPETLDLLLKSSDCLGKMLLDIKEQQSTDGGCALELKKDFENIAKALVRDSALGETAQKGAVIKTEDKIKKTSSNITSIRVATEKIDSIVNTIEELIIIESVLKQSTAHLDLKLLRKFQETLDDLAYNSRRLQEGVLQMRMVPLSFAINRFPRMVLDVSQKLGKTVELVISGEQTEIDKTMVDKITDPLMHLIRNAIDHGIESKEEREKQGKNIIGRIQLNAYQSGNNIVIDVIDDGGGLNADKIRASAIAKGIITAEQPLSEAECYRLIFEPGFSTAAQITDLSGRGVGLDVVSKNIQELGGSVEVISIPKVSTTFSMRLPLTLAVLDCQLIKIGEQVAAIPLIGIREMLKLDPDQLLRKKDGSEYYHLRDANIPIFQIDKILSIETEKTDLNQKFLIITQVKDTQYGFVCDDLLIQQQVVIKNIEENYCKVPGIAGGTVLGNGDVALILDVKEMSELALGSLVSLNKIKETVSAPVTESIEGVLSKSPEYLCFLIEGKEYGFNVQEVQEVSIFQNSAALPFSPAFVLGAINLRGLIIPIVDLRMLITETISDHPLTQAIIVVRLQYENRQKFVGMLVDAVTGIETVGYTEIAAPQPNACLRLQDNIQGFVKMRGKFITLLSTHNFVDFGEQKWGLV